MRFKNIEDALAFYKRYANCVGFSARKSSTTKNKSGKIWKVFVCSKQGYRKRHKSPPQSAVALANAISRARENVEERRVKRRRVETREGCNARMVVSSMNDGQFELLKEIPACFKVDRWTKLAAKKSIFELDTIVSTSYAQVGQQNRMISDAWSWLYKCMDLVGQDVDKLQYVINAAESIQQKLEEVVNGGSMSNASTDLQTYFGCTVPDIIEIQPTPVSVTKGRAKRMKTGVEKAVEQQMHARMCHYCKQVTSHDSRNRPEKRN
ncbi:hypothetical protein Cgig2_024954 [Carnegiea gigantea]|uniref:FAR1 domain-containing protein n=1 Tax=Carnegiea gigantea TaxID=171969 RepID=A0A9Q1GIA8_9CARY|nr:hypothetical protein Cgig2_024954 [Carnegiea gigantea]